MDFAAALPTFVVTLREGVEAALVVGIVLAYLKKADQARLNPWVWGGILVGIGASLLVGVLFVSVLSWLDASSQASARGLKLALEGVFGVVAIALLSWMLVWMTRQARALKSEVEGTVATALQQDRAGWGVFGLITIAVLREGFETVLFIAAKFQQGWVPVAGAIAGLVGATCIGFLIFQMGVKINLRRFFQVMGILLLLIVSGLVVSTLRHFDAAAIALSQINPRFSDLCPATGSCFLGSQVWDLSQTLPDKQFPGVLLKAFFGYTQRLYLVQAIAYVTFLSIMANLYLRSLQPTPAQPSSPATKDLVKN